MSQILLPESDGLLRCKDEMTRSDAKTCPTSPILRLTKIHMATTFHSFSASKHRSLATSLISRDLCLHSITVRDALPLLVWPTNNLHALSTISSCPSLGSSCTNISAYFSQILVHLSTRLPECRYLFTGSPRFDDQTSASPTSAPIPAYSS